MENTLTNSDIYTDSGNLSPRKITVGCKDKNKFIPRFMIGVLLLAVVSLVYLNIDWLKIAGRIPQIGTVFFKLAHFDFGNIGLIGSAILETVSIAVLSLLYSLVLGIVFGMLAARNITKIKWFSVATQSFFTCMYIKKRSYRKS